MHAKATASNHLVKANKSCHGPRVIAKERVRRERENPKENPMVPNVQKVRIRVKPQKLVYMVLKTEFRDKFRNSVICTDVSQ